MLKLFRDNTGRYKIYVFFSSTRTNSLLEKVCEGVGAEYFYACLWDCLASNSGIRLPAISFVLAHFNKKQTMEEQKYIMGTNTNIMVRNIAYVNIKYNLLS